jgi:multiple sugar transport system permease protein
VNRHRAARLAQHFATYLLIALVLAFFLMPIVWLFQTSLKPSRDAFAIPPIWWFEPTLINFERMFAATRVTEYLRNSLVIATGTTIVSVVLGLLAGYGLARHPSRTSDVLALAMLAVRMAPPVAMLIPFYLMMRDLGLLGSYPAVILLQSVLNTAFVTWLMRGYFLTLPKDMEESALIDGCNRFQAFLYVALPMAGPGVTTGAIFTFTLSWNDFLLPLILAGRRTRPLTLGILEAFSSVEIAWSAIAAMSVVTVLPVVLIGLLLQRYLIRGMTLGAIRG